MQAYSICKKCKCVEWHMDKEKLRCKRCSTGYSTADKWHMICYNEEIATADDGLVTFVGDVKEHGINE